jgi:hypothetical protein
VWFLLSSDDWKERCASMIRVIRIGELGTTLPVVIIFLRSVHRLLLSANVVPSSQILVTVMMEAIRSSETRFLQEPFGVTSQKTAFFTVTAVKNSNLTGSYASEYHCFSSRASFILRTSRFFCPVLESVIFSH